MSKPTKLVIDRRKWLRGKESLDDSGLRVVTISGKYKMCCMGFYSLACGLTKEEIEGKTFPAEALSGATDIPVGMEWLVDQNLGNSEEARNLADKNDSFSISDSQREQYITEVFAQHGVEVEFIGEVA